MLTAMVDTFNLWLRKGLTGVVLKIIDQNAPGKDVYANPAQYGLVNNTVPTCDATKIKATATGSVAFLGEVLTARNVAPTVLVNCHFGKSGDMLRPYLGMGLNYTKLTDITTPYGWDVKLSNSVGMAVQAGLDYQLSKNWGLFASVARVDVQSKLTAVGATVLQSKINFRPITYAAGLSYRF